MKKQWRYAASILIFMMFLPSFAHAGQCIDLGMDGVWRNTDSNTRGITKMRINLECRDVSRRVDNGNGTSTITYAVKPIYRVHTWGKCHPNDCDWRTRDGLVNVTSQGNHRVDVSYNQGFAVKTLKLSKVLSGSRAGQLRVSLLNRFTDNSGRRNYTRVYYLKR